MFLPRLISTLSLLTSLFVLVVFSHGTSGMIIPVLLSLLSFFSIKELYIMLKNKNIDLEYNYFAFLSVIYIFGLYFFLKSKTDWYAFDLSCLFIILFVSFSASFFSKNKFQTNDKSLEKIAFNLLAFIYAPWCLGFLMKILFFPGIDGRYFIIFLILVSKSSDIFAYVTGKLCGKRKLAPAISPNKTIEGAIGGILGSIITGSMAQFTLISNYLSLAQIIIISFFIAIVSISGDLAESFIKRDALVKDSGNTIPGLGGVLDLVDSILFTAPLMYFLMVFFI